MAHSYRKEIQRLPETLTIVDKERKIALIGNSAFVSPVSFGYHSTLLRALTQRFQYYGVYNE